MRAILNYWSKNQQNDKTDPIFITTGNMLVAKTSEFDLVENNKYIVEDIISKDLITITNSNSNLKNLYSRTL